MDIQILINHYKSIFTKNQDILEWIEHDLMHMGISDEAIEGHLFEARRRLEAQS